MIFRLLAALGLIAVLCARAAEPSAPVMILAIGAAGEDAYAAKFTAAAETLQKACAQGGVRCISIGLETNEADGLPLLKSAVENAATTNAAPLWIVLLGHGSFDGREAKFNLRGDDLTATELAGWLKPVKRPLIVIAASASSGPFLQKLSAPGRAVITATRSGYEQNYAHFSEYFPAALADPKADVDNDGQTSLLEAFLSAARQTAEFYEAEGRLATEHALIDDNGDALGTQADFFKGLRVARKSKEGQEPDGMRAHQIHLVPSATERLLSPAVRAQRDEIELALARLRADKASLPEDDYYTQFETLVLRLARLYETAAQRAD